jgi:hypothetical protein
MNPADGLPLPVAPSLAPALASVHAPPPYTPVDRRVVVISAIAIVVATGAALLAELLVRLIGHNTNIA